MHGYRLAAAALLVLLSPAPGMAKVTMVPTKCPVAAAKSFKVVGAKGEIDGIASEYIWLEKNMPGWIRTEQALISRNEKLYDILYIQKGKKKINLCFDITDFFGKL